jgi:MFS superfamily sulfate permease-like transporter
MFQHIKQDFPAAIVVFLVALPLCLGIALASGAPPLSGLIAGIIGGVVVGALSQSPLGVSGPAAGLTVIVLNGINSLPSFEIFLSAVVVAGIFQALLGILRAGVIGLYFPSSVIQGMLAAIGIIIFLKQLPHAVGYDADPEGEMEFIQADGYNTFTEIAHAFSLMEPLAILIAAVSLAILLLWETPLLKRQSWAKLLPGSLLAVTAGILIQQWGGGTAWALSSDHLVSIPEMTDGISSLVRTPDFSAILSPEVLILGITIAIVASLETLLCVEATDKLDPHKRVTPTNRELIAQGIGNSLSGLIGGLPLTQVIVRSSANIQSGGVTKLSAILHGLLLIVSVLIIPNVLNMIPLASLAAILLVVGFKLAKPAQFRAMATKGNRQFVPFIITILAILFTDLLIGIGIGLAAAIVAILLDHYNRPFVEYHVNPQSQICTLVLPADVTFLHKAGIREALASIPTNGKVVLDASNNQRMDVDVEEIIDDFKSRAIEEGIELVYHNPPKREKLAKPLASFKKALLLSKEKSEGDT